MLSYDVLEAFKSAGVPDEKARKAAEALASSEDVRFVRIDEGVLRLDARLAKTDDRLAVLDGRMVKAEAKLDFHTWMFGVVVVLNVAILVRL